MKDRTVNRFRSKRGAILRKRMDELQTRLGRRLRVLDLGGRPDYWDNVGIEGCDEIILLNNERHEMERGNEDPVFQYALGDACDLKDFADGSFDLVHSNSVIEHVGQWPRMEAMADEARRVGTAGWIQTPAWEFPWEPHFGLPFAQWMPAPTRRVYVALNPLYRRMPLKERRRYIDGSNLVSHREFRALFEGVEVYVERLMLLPKSYVAMW